MASRYPPSWSDPTVPLSSLVGAPDSNPAAWQYQALGLPVPSFSSGANLRSGGAEAASGLSRIDFLNALYAADPQRTAEFIASNGTWGEYDDSGDTRTGYRVKPDGSGVEEFQRGGGALYDVGRVAPYVGFGAAGGLTAASALSGAGAGAGAAGAASSTAVPSVGAAGVAVPGAIGAAPIAAGGGAAAATGGGLLGTLASPGVSTAIGAGTSVLGAYLQSRAQNKATDANAQALNNALDFEKGVYADQSRIAQPFINTGTQATGNLANYLNNPYTLPTADQVRQSPGYQYGMDETARKLEGSAFARGVGLTGRAGQALSHDLNDYALSQYAQYNNMALGARQQNVGENQSAVEQALRAASGAKP